MPVTVFRCPIHHFDKVLSWQCCQWWKHADRGGRGRGRGRGGGRGRGRSAAGTAPKPPKLYQPQLNSCNYAFLIVMYRVRLSVEGC